jgi:hypothetical protein
MGCCGFSPSLPVPVEHSSSLHRNCLLTCVQENVRIATFLSLRMKVTGEVLYVINTHYDHRGFQARAESSRMIREHAFEWVTGVEEELGLADKHRGPVILMGDLSGSRNLHDTYIPFVDAELIPRAQTLIRRWTATSSSPPQNRCPRANPPSPLSTATPTSKPDLSSPRIPANRDPTAQLTHSPTSSLRGASGPSGSTLS